MKNNEKIIREILKARQFALARSNNKAKGNGCVLVSPAAEWQVEMRPAKLCDLKSLHLWQ